MFLKSRFSGRCVIWLLIQNEVATIHLNCAPETSNALVVNDFNVISICFTIANILDSK